MIVREVFSKEEWENFVSSCVEKTFLQSWNWGDFNHRLGNQIWRLGIYENERLLGVALTLKIKAKRGTFLFIPHGPLLMDFLSYFEKKEVFSTLLFHLKIIAGREKASFIRIAPVFLKNEEDQRILSQLGFRRAPLYIHPEVTWELDITPSLNDLLMGMRKTTRYLIKQAQKNREIRIVKSRDINDLNHFWPVYLETAKRHRFVVYSEDYLKKEMEIFLPDDEVLLFLGYFQEKVVSAAIFIFWQDICFYHHAGSLTQYRKIPVSYLLQWEAIQEAKLRGCKKYNFWGISLSNNPSHPWSGFTFFKTGFGGDKKEYIPTQDFILSSKYWINFWIEKIIKLKRGV